MICHARKQTNRSVATSQTPSFVSEVTKRRMVTLRYLFPSFDIIQ